MYSDIDISLVYYSILQSYNGGILITKGLESPVDARGQYDQYKTRTL